MRCKQCGNELPENARICNRCETLTEYGMRSADAVEREVMRHEPVQGVQAQELRPGMQVAGAQGQLQGQPGRTRAESQQGGSPYRAPGQSAPQLQGRPGGYPAGQPDGMNYGGAGQTAAYPTGQPGRADYRTANRPASQPGYGGNGAGYVNNGYNDRPPKKKRGGLIALIVILLLLLVGGGATGTYFLFFHGKTVSAEKVWDARYPKPPVSLEGKNFLITHSMAYGGKSVLTLFSFREDAKNPVVVWDQKKQTIALKNMADLQSKTVYLLNDGKWEPVKSEGNDLAETVMGVESCNLDLHGLSDEVLMSKITKDGIKKPIDTKYEERVAEMKAEEKKRQEEAEEKRRKEQEERKRKEEEEKKAEEARKEEEKKKAEEEAKAKAEEERKQKEAEEQKKQEEQARQGTAASGGGSYIIPDSSQRYLSEGDLAGMSQWQCMMARNEIYARHGRLFNDPTIQSYFDQQGWYHGSIAPEYFNDGVFSDIERRNLDTIVNYEKQMGWYR